MSPPVGDEAARAAGSEPRAPGSDSGAPRVLRVRLAAPLAPLAPHATGEPPRALATLESWRGSSPAVDRVGRAGGAALAAAWIHDHPRGADGRTPLVIAVGDAVRRGLPTAARATVASRAPLTGRYADGQVGGELARRLAAVCDALVIEGSLQLASGAGCARQLLLVRSGSSRGARAEPSVELLPAGPLEGLEPRALGEALGLRFPGAATLAIGRAGVLGSPLASLVAGGSPPHFVGRGGLGAVLGAAGLLAVVVAAEPQPAERDPGLAELLASSPRLVARSEGGTLELFEDLAARGEREQRAAARRVAEQAAAAPARRHGCRGCPTPCGLEFETPRGGVGARFGAARALGLELGLGELDEALVLQQACDEIGADAKELGAALALLARARRAGRAPGPELFGRPEALLEAVRGVAPADGGPPRGDGAQLFRGAAALARALGLERPEAEEPRAARVEPRGEPADERADGPAEAPGGDPPAGSAASGGALERGRGLASLLGQAAASRGADPMRSFPFLAADASGPEGLARLVAPLPVPAGALDPARPEGKGRLVWWHEHLALALDTTGFCAFSAAALLADGGCDLDRLARHLAPEAMRPAGGARPGAHAAAFLEAGEQLARLIRLVDLRLAGPGAQGLAPALASRLDRPGLWPEYARLRGLDARGDPTAELERDFERGRPTRAAELLGEEPAAAPAPRPAEPFTGTARSAGRVTVRLGGPLARSLGRELELALPLPAPAQELVARLAARTRELGADEAAALLDPERGPPVVYRDGARLAPAAEVRDGDLLDLLLVISGGSR